MKRSFDAKRRPSISYNEKPLIKSDRSMIALDLQKVASIIAYLVTKRRAMLTRSEIDFSKLMLYSFLSFGGLYLPDVMMFMRKLFTSLKEHGYSMMHTGMFDQITCEAGLLVNIMQQKAMPADQCCYYNILGCKERMDAI